MRIDPAAGNPVVDTTLIVVLDEFSSTLGTGVPEVYVRLVVTVALIIGPFHTPAPQPLPNVYTGKPAVISYLAVTVPPPVAVDVAADGTVMMYELRSIADVIWNPWV
jgi:hypothetical protein